MPDKTQSTIRIKWIRSGIGFSYYQKRIVRSLGLSKLNQELDKPDTPQVRGLVAKVPHLVTIVKAAPKPAWMSVPEYTIFPPAAEAEKPVAAAAADVAAAPAPATEQEQPAGAQAVAQPDAPAAAAPEPAASKGEEQAEVAEAAAGTPEDAPKPGESPESGGE